MIIVSGVSKELGGRLVLDGIDLHVRDGETVALAGGGGAGRTTLLRILATLLRPGAGTVEIGGVDAVRHPIRVRRHVAFAPAVPVFREHLSAAEYLGFLGAARIADAGRRAAALAGAIELAGIDPEASIRRLSQGQAQRLAVAAALLPDAEIRLLDEPFSAQDGPARSALAEALLRRRRAGETIVAACNRPDEVAGLFDHVVALREGRVVGEEPRGGSVPATPDSSGGRHVGA